MATAPVAAQALTMISSHPFITSLHFAFQTPSKVGQRSQRAESDGCMFARPAACSVVVVCCVALILLGPFL